METFLVRPLSKYVRLCICMSFCLCDLVKMRGKVLVCHREGSCTVSQEQSCAERGCRFCHPGSLGSTTYNSFSGFASPPEKQDKNFTASQEHNPLPVAVSGFVAQRWEALQKHVIFFLALLLMNALVALIKVFKRIILSCCAFTTSSHRAHLSAEMCAPTDSPRCTASFSPAPARPPLPSDTS